MILIILIILIIVIRNILGLGWVIFLQTMIFSALYVKQIVICHNNHLHIFVYFTFLNICCLCSRKKAQKLVQKNTKLETNSGLLIVKIILDISALNLAYLVGGGGIEITIKEEGQIRRSDRLGVGIDQKEGQIRRDRQIMRDRQIRRKDIFGGEIEQEERVRLRGGIDLKEIND